MDFRKKRATAPVTPAPARPAPSLEDRSNNAAAMSAYALDLIDTASSALLVAADEQDAVSALAIAEAESLYRLAEEVQDQGDLSRVTANIARTLINVG